jgi:uncharacterized protein YukE
MRPPMDSSGGRPTGWDVLGYDKDPVPGDAGSIRALASIWEAAHTSIHTAGVSVNSASNTASSPTAWQGESSTKFVGDISEVYTGYSAASLWFHGAAGALKAFAHVVEQTQTKADKALAKAKVAKNTASTAQSTHDTAHSSLEWFTHQSDDVQKANKDEMDTLRTTITNSAQDVSDAHTVISNQTTKAQNAKALYDAAATVCTNALDDIATAVGGAPALPGATPVSYSKSGHAKSGTWTVGGGGDGDNGYQFSYGAGAYSTVGANYTHGDGTFAASAVASGLVGAEASIDGQKTYGSGWNQTTLSGNASILAGIYGTATAKAGYKDGKFDAALAATVGMGVKATAGGSVSALNGLVKVRGSVTGQAGGEANASASVHAGKDGVAVQGDAGAFFGGRIGADGGGDVGNVASADVGGGLRAGWGGEIGGGGSFKADDVGVTVKLGLSVFVGADINLDVHVHPESIVKDVGGGLKDAGGAVKHFFHL